MWNARNIWSVHSYLPPFVSGVFLVAGILCFFFPVSVDAATYYVSMSSGNDGNPGTQAQPWKTIAKVNASTFFADDSILFKRGDIWREQLMIPSSGTENRHILFASYGSGDKPIINGADLKVSDDFKNEPANYWYANNATDPKAVYRNGNRLSKQSLKANVDSTTEWYYDSANQRVYLYDTVNPATSNYIEFVTRNNGISSNENSHVIIQDLEITKTKTDGIVSGSRSNGITIRDCVVHENIENAIGIYGFSSYNRRTLIQRNKLYNFGIAPSTPGKGNGVLISGTGTSNRVENALIEYNNVYDGGTDKHDHGVYEQGYQTTVRYNRFSNITGFGIKINNEQSGGENGGGNQSYYNIITDCDDGGILVESTTSGPVNNKVYNNTLYGNGNNETGTKIAGLQYTKGSGTPVGNEWRNNIVYSTANNRSSFYVMASTAVTGLIASNNLYYSTNSQYWYVAGYYTSLANWQTVISGDSESLNSDPLFVSSSNYHLQVSSPAIDVGTSVGLTTDYEGNPVPSGFAPSIGAYEHGGVPAFYYCTAPSNLRIQ